MKKDGKAFSYVDKSEDELYLFLSNTKKVKVTHYDNKFNFIDTLTTTIPGSKSDNMIGFTKNESSVNLIWTSKKGEQFIFQNFDFTTKKVTSTTTNLNFNRETLVQTFSSNEAFYCLSIVNQSSILKLYRFSNSNELEVKTIDVSSVVFNDSSNARANLYDLLAEKFESFESSFELQNIDVSLPNSLAICSKKRKAYFSNDELILTFDNNSLSTQIVKIQLSNFVAETIIIKKPEEMVGSNQSNSFLFESHLYVFKISSNQLLFRIHTLQGTIVKEYNTNSNEEISFKNSDFLGEWVNKSKTNKLENTEQFIANLNNNQTGISCYNYKGNTLVSFGGVSQRIEKIDPNEPNNTMFIPLMVGGAIGGMIYATAYVLLGGYDGTNFFYSNFKSSRNIVSVNSLFSKNFELQTDKVNTYAGNKICSYFNGYAEIKNPISFSTQQKAYIGSYNQDAKQYVIIRFDN